MFSAGSHSISWNGSDDSGRKLNPGLYICVLKSGNCIFKGKNHPSKTVNKPEA